MVRAHTIENIKATFEAAGCKLLSDVYENKTTRLKYICSCGYTEPQTICYNIFVKGVRCKKCQVKKIQETNIAKYSMKAPTKYTIDSVRAIFEKEECKLVSTEYQGNKKPLEYMCSCGSKDIHKVNLNNFLTGRRCKDCIQQRREETMIKTYGYHHPMKNEENSKARRLKYEDVKKNIEEQNCELLSDTYEGNKQKLKIKYRCGHVGETSYNEFHNGRRCGKIECTRQKTKDTCQQKYGVSSYSKSTDFKESIVQIMREKFGKDYYFQTDEYKNKMREYNLNRYGVEHYFQSKDFKEKATNTNMIRYGVPICSQNRDIMEKISRTNLERYNCKCTLTNPEIRKKTQDRILSIYGVDNVARSSIVQEKKKITSREKYGCDYPLQNPDIISKIKRSSYMSKIYKFLSGKTTLIQGFENFALDYLLNELKFVEYDIVTNELEMPQFIYFEDCKYRRYFPDIYIPKENLIIEVKSEFTFGIDNHQIFTKCKTVKYNGYNMWLMIFGKKGELLKWIMF